jgi:hypothetical protein
MLSLLYWLLTHQLPWVWECGVVWPIGSKTNRNQQQLKLDFFSCFYIKVRQVIWAWNSQNLSHWQMKLPKSEVILLPFCLKACEDVFGMVSLRWTEGTWPMWPDNLDIGNFVFCDFYILEIHRPVILRNVETRVFQKLCVEVQFSCKLRGQIYSKGFEKKIVFAIILLYRHA